jgi:dATP pyrophosphohydrolase
MPKVKSSRVAVYVYRKAATGPEFLQLHRVDGRGEYAGIWGTVYGGIKAGETAIEAALREVHEETGLRPTTFHQVEFLETFYQRSKDRINMLPVFAAQAPRQFRVTLNDEHDAFRWTPLSAVGQCFLWRVQREAIAVIHEDIISARSPAVDILKISVD